LANYFGNTKAERIGREIERNEMMSAKSQTKQITYLRGQVNNLLADNQLLSQKLSVAKAKKDYLLPSGMYLEQDPSGNLILHVPAETTYFPVVLSQDGPTAYAQILRIFHNQKILPHKIGTDAVPTERILKEWEDRGGTVITNRKLKVEDFNP
jgi:hypothetical protein